MTHKLYWSDSHLTRFTARVIEASLADGAHAIVLDQTAFYPTGGGQPSDVGTLASARGTARVSQVESADDGRILHRLANDVGFEIGEEITGEVDWQRRRELMQQHTGQHILSQAFFQLFGAETKGFRMNDHAAEIDLTLEARSDEIAQAIERAEDLANSIVFDDREVRIHEVTPEQAARLPLRKESFITDSIRVIEIADYDFSPCGGTHVKRTGEVGLIAVRGWERAKKMMRVHFVCGVRALHDYRAANRTAETIARRFTVGRDEAAEAVERLLDEQKRLVRRARELAAMAAQAEAQELLAATTETGGLRIVTHIFNNRDFEEAKLLAHRLVANNGVVALLAVCDAERARVIFARAADVSADMDALLKAACHPLGGRGGGNSDFAQGGVKPAEMEIVLTTVQAKLVHSSLQPAAKL